MQPATCCVNGDSKIAATIQSIITIYLITQAKDNNTLGIVLHLYNAIS